MFYDYRRFKRPPSWTHEFRILEKHESIPCACGSSFVINGASSHSRICKHTFESLSTYTSKKRGKLAPGLRNLAHARFYPSQIDARKKHDQYIRVVRKLKSRQHCKYCGKLYYGKFRTCSKQCAYSLMSQSMDYAGNGKKISLTRIKNKCGAGIPSWNLGICGSDYWNRIKRKDESEDDVRTRICKSWFKKTSIECSIEQILIDLKIEFQHNRFICRRSFDFVISSLKIIIECDGDYWHGNQERFPILSDRQILKQIDDRLKDKSAKEYGYIILRFWETDLRNNLDEIKKLIFEVINQNEKSINKIEENYTRRGGQYIRCYSAR